MLPAPGHTDKAMTGDTRERLPEIARVFLKLGLVGFGGPAAHIAMMEDEVVRRRRWMTREHFLDLIGATNLIPGPNSTEMAIHVGREQGGWPGLIVAGTCFIAPAFLIVLGCAWAYVRYGTLPVVEGLLYGVKPAVIAVVAQALWGLGRAAVKSWILAGVGMLALAAAAAGLHELVVLFAAGALLATRAWIANRRLSARASVLLPLVSLAGAPAAGAAAVSGGAAFGLVPLFLFFLKVGSVLFGSGYVLLAFLRADLVERWGWMTEGQLLDAVAIGQVTPGPVFTTATFIGYLLGRVPGAILATVGIFLPAFLFVAASAPLIPRLRRSAVAAGALDGVNVASLALMALVAAQLARSAIVDVPTLTAAILSAFLLLRFRVSSAWLILGGGLMGVIARWP